MFDFFFDAFTTFHAVAFLFGAFLFLAIGGGLIAWWVSWRVRSIRVKGRIVAVKETGTRRSDAEWAEQYSQEAAAQKEEIESRPGFFEGMLPDFKKNPFKTAGAYLLVLVFVCMPFGFFGIGAWFAYDYINLTTTGYEVKAKVVDYETTYDSESGTMYYPVVLFEDHRGRSHRLKDKLGTGSRSFSTGSEVDVFYDPDDPAHFTIRSFWRYMGFAFAFMGISSIFIIIMGLAVFGKFDSGGPRDPEARRRAIAKLKRKHYANQYYTPVYQFNGPNGQVIRAEGHDDTDNWLVNKLPGTQVKLMVVPGKDGTFKVKRPGKILLIFGLIFAASGLFVLNFSLSQLSWSFGSFAAILGMLGFAGYKMRGLLALRHDKDFRSFLDAKKGIKDIKIETAPQTGGYEMTPQEIRERLKVVDRQAVLAVPVLIIFGIGLMFGGYALFKDMNNLSGIAMVAQGEIVGSNSRSSSEGGYTYYPVVAFKALDGRKYTFEGKTGSSPPMFDVGDKVMVLYDPDRPEKAIIDHGWLNWLPSLGLMLLGALMVFWALRLSTGAIARSRRR